MPLPKSIVTSDTFLLITNALFKYNFSFNIKDWIFNLKYYLIILPLIKNSYVNSVSSFSPNKQT